jgi:hypothetical protein
MKTVWLEQPPREAPPPEAAMPGAWAAQAVSTQAELAQGNTVQVATMGARRSMAARLSMSARRAMTFENGMVKTTKTMAARECRAEERGEMHSRLPNHATTPPRYAAS